MTHDVKNNTYDYKHTFCVEVVPVCRGDLLCLPKKIAQILGNMNQLVVCVRVNNVVSVIDPNTLQIADVNALVKCFYFYIIFRLRMIDLYYKSINIKLKFL